MRVHRACHDGYISCTFPDCHEGFSSANALIKHQRSHDFDFAEQEQQEFKEIKRGISPMAEPRVFRVTVAHHGWRHLGIAAHADIEDLIFPPGSQLQNGVVKVALWTGHDLHETIP
ncbi:hypothetical protein MVEG_09626 [Podila verticillata NRRL 6337]|nr:hypothetical protein MVEG_09626 [Podila verticillata NRRL 6337]